MRAPRTHRARRAGLVLLSIVSVMALAAGCASDSEEGGGGTTLPPADERGDVVIQPTGEPQTGGTLIYGLEAETDGWNPSVNRWAASAYVVANAIYDPLTAFSAENEAQPYLAESFTPNEDFSLWTITLRPDVSFHDGTPVDGEAVAKFLNAMKASLLTGSALQPMDTANATGPLTVEVEMNQPWSAFPAIMATQAGMVAAPVTLDSDEGVRNPVGSGPFVFDEWVVNSSLSATRNDSYWREGLPYLAGVEFRPIPDAQTRVAALSAGDIDMLHTSDTPTINRLQEQADDGSIQLVYGKGESEESLVLLNTDNPPMDNLKVRQAMAYAIDSEAMRNINEVEASRVARGMFPPDSPWYVETDYPTFDLARAQQLVQEAEAEIGGPVSFILGSTTSPDVQMNAQLLAQFWTEAGMQVQLETFEQPQLIDNALSGDFQAQLWRQFGSQDPDSDMIWFDGQNADPPLPLNFARNRDPVIDQAILDGRATDDFETRKEAYATVQRQHATDLPYLWLSHTVWVLAFQNNIRGVTGQTLPDGTPSSDFRNGSHRITQVWFEN